MERPIDESIPPEYLPPTADAVANRMAYRPVNVNVDASPSRLRGSLRSGRALVAATAPKIAARLPVTVTVTRKPPTYVPIQQSQVAVRPPDGTFVPMQVSSETVVREEVSPYAPHPYQVPHLYRVVVPKKPWNALAVLALPLALLLPLAGFLTGVVAVRQIRRTGDRGMALGTLGWIFGLTNTLFLAFAITIAVVGYAIKAGIEDGVHDAIVSIVDGILQWLFG
ncbi:hypothetical protein [Fodinicola feengrottensis]|uniref:DUF4190 domain-containing protein n=1 Tax=Fodinicola feengrottensis TaxID=435914 RepID=A0ABN2HZ40_9ACTN|nr:hypothetical protein [Fodinicola feengrottensis]